MPPGQCFLSAGQPVRSSISLALDTGIGRSPLRCIESRDGFVPMRLARLRRVKPFGLAARIASKKGSSEPADRLLLIAMRFSSCICSLTVLTLVL